MGDKCSVDLKVGRLNLKITIESISKLTSSTSVRIATSRSHKIMGMLEPFTPCNLIKPKLNLGWPV